MGQGDGTSTPIAAESVAHKPDADASANSATPATSTDAVHLSEAMYRDFINLPRTIRPKVKVEGLNRVGAVVIQRDIDTLSGSRTVSELVGHLEQVRGRWLRTELFDDVAYDFEPLPNTATSGDVLVRLRLNERRVRQELGVFTSDSAVPEVRMKLYNLLGRGYSLQAHYVPPSSKTHSWSVNAISYTPWLGDRLEFTFGRTNTQYVLRAADAERMDELKAVLEKQGPKRTQSLTAGWQRRELAARDTSYLPPDVANDIGPKTDKVFVRHDVRWHHTAHHAHPLLYRAYPLPVSGSDVHLSQEVSGGSLGGQVSKLKQHLFAAKYYPLHPLVNLAVSLRVGAVWNLGEDRFTNDRLFLGWRHVRGHESIGPSTLTPEGRADIPSYAVAKYAALGGNALWAATASLNFPLPGFPYNGLVACHAFCNVGNVTWLPTWEDLRLKWRELFTEPPASIGFGLVMTQVPILGGVLPNGRLEANVQVPLRWSSARRNLEFSAGNPSLFKRFKFGLIWSGEYE